MIPFDRLSFWEKRTWIENIDFAVIGAGIVGCTCALELRRNYPKAKIVVLERGYLPTGASTKNAGFACFGSVTEILDDLENIPADRVWSTLQMRFNGLKKLRERFTDSQTGLRIRGSWDLIDDNDGQLSNMISALPELNKMVEELTGIQNCYQFDEKIQTRCGFYGLAGGFYSKAEGELETDKLMFAFHKKMVHENIMVLNGVEVSQFSDVGTHTLLQSNFGELRAKKMAVAVNGFAGSFLKDDRIQPARAQVLVSDVIPEFTLPGTFHYQQGYFYFREIENRLFIGGGRNINKEAETTELLENTTEITDAIKKLVGEKFLPNKEVRWEYQWSGIMGVGTEKLPVIERRSSRMAVGVRLGGMGVAIGSLVGEQLAALLSED